MTAWTSLQGTSRFAPFTGQACTSRFGTIFASASADAEPRETRGPARGAFLREPPEVVLEEDPALGEVEDDEVEGVGRPVGDVEQRHRVRTGLDPRLAFEQLERSAPAGPRPPRAPSVTGLASSHAHVRLEPLRGDDRRARGGDRAHPPEGDGWWWPKAASSTRLAGNFAASAASSATETSSPSGASIRTRSDSRSITSTRVSAAAISTDQSRGSELDDFEPGRRIGWRTEPGDSARRASGTPTLRGGGGPSRNDASWSSYSSVTDEAPSKREMRVGNLDVAAALVARRTASTCRRRRAAHARPEIRRGRPSRRRRRAACRRARRRP